MYRTVAKGTWSDHVDWNMEVYLTKEDNDQVIVARMVCLNTKNGKHAVQFLVADYMEKPPKGHM